MLVPRVQRFYIDEDCLLLLCSDGIWNMIDDGALREMLLASDDCAVIVQDAIRRALAGGAPDNATLIVARCVGLPTL